MVMRNKARLVAQGELVRPLHVLQNLQTTMDNSHNSNTCTRMQAGRAARTAPSRKDQECFLRHTDLFDWGDPLPWPRRGHERAGRAAAGVHEGELADEGGAEAEEDAPRPCGPRWQGGATDTWGGGGAGAKRPRAGPSQSDEEVVGACREGGHGDEQAASVRRGTGRDAAMCSAREREIGRAHV